MKLRLFHRNPSHAGKGSPLLYDTLGRVGVACIALTPEGEITEINTQAHKALRIGGGNFRTR